jgi:hypothetical protein
VAGFRKNLRSACAATVLLKYWLGLLGLVLSLVNLGTRGKTDPSRFRECTHKSRDWPARLMSACPRSGAKADMPGGPLRARNGLMR